MLIVEGLPRDDIGDLVTDSLVTSIDAAARFCQDRTGGRQGGVSIVAAGDLGIDGVRRGMTIVVGCDVGDWRSDDVRTTEDNG